MNTRERMVEPENRLNPQGSGHGDLDAVQASAQNFLSMADNLIRQSLSNDSEAFLSQSRQQGGQ